MTVRNRWALNPLTHCCMWYPRLVARMCPNPRLSPFLRARALTDAHDSLHRLCRYMKESAGMLSLIYRAACRALVPKESLWRGVNSRGRLRPWPTLSARFEPRECGIRVSGSGTEMLGAMPRSEAIVARYG